MTLPKIKHKKLIKPKEFLKVAEKVKKSLEKEAEYMFEKKMKNGDKISTQSFNHS